MWSRLYDLAPFIPSSPAAFFFIHNGFLDNSRTCQGHSRPQDFILNCSFCLKPFSSYILGLFPHFLHILKVTFLMKPSQTTYSKLYCPFQHSLSLSLALFFSVALNYILIYYVISLLFYIFLVSPQ